MKLGGRSGKGDGAGLDMEQRLAADGESAISKGLGATFRRVLTSDVETNSIKHHGVIQFTDVKMKRSIQQTILSSFPVSKF